jgi:hypothetical protein
MTSPPNQRRVPARNPNRRDRRGQDENARANDLIDDVSREGSHADGANESFLGATKRAGDRIVHVEGA